LFDELSGNYLFASLRELVVKKGGAPAAALSIGVRYKGAEAVNSNAHFINLYSLARMIFS
jgi:hypothetical protein